MMPAIRRALPIILAVAATAAMGSPAPGQLHEGDIILRVREGGSIETGGFSPGLVAPQFPRRVFGATADVDGFFNDPGFDAEPGTFVPGTPIAFDVLTSLRRWDGVDFDATASARLRVRFGGSQIFTPATDVLQSGFSITADSAGAWHRHLGYQFFDADPLLPEPGVFLLSLRLRGGTGTPGPSEPFHLVVNRDALTADADAALAWVEANLVAPPSPGCPADFNGDTTLNDDDLSEFITAYFETLAGPGFYADPAGCPGAEPPFDAAGFRADFTRDCSLNDDDLGGFITAYFTGCE